MTDNGSQQQATPQSFLIADCGHVNTTVALFDVAVDSYHLIARATVGTTAEPPWNDITLGVRQAIHRLTAVSGRPLLDRKENLIKPARANGSGVDHFAFSTSAAAPLQTILIGLSDDVSLSSARRALDNVYTNEIDKFDLSDDRDEKEMVKAFLKLKPDLIFITGGTDGGAEKRLLTLIKSANLGINVLRSIKTPHLVFAGNKELRERVQHIIGSKVKLIVTDNVRPELNHENLDDAIKTVSALYTEQLSTLAGIDTLKKWSDLAPLLTAQAFAISSDYFASLNGGTVVGIDLGSHSVTLLVADPDLHDLTINADMGSGYAAKVLAVSTVQDITRWLPYEIKEAAVRDYIYNKSLHPRIIPATEAELLLEQAFAREMMRHVVNDTTKQWLQSDDGRLPPFQLLLVRGRMLTNAPRTGQALLMLLDALQPTGIFAVALDTYGVLSALGTLATLDPLAAVQTLENGVLQNLGWVVVPVGKGQPDQIVLNVTLNAGSDSKIEVEVAYGTIEIIPLEPNRKTEVLLTPARRFDIGLGQGVAKKISIQSSSVGLLIDARGRPLTLPDDDEERQSLIRDWIRDVGG